MDILKNDTDEDNPITTEEIIDRMQLEGLEVERKTVYDDILCLTEAGYDIIQKRGRANMYAIANKNFDDVEIQMLLDAVYSSNFISKKKSDDLAKRLCSLMGNKRGETLLNECSNYVKFKNVNEHIWYNIDDIRSALNKNKIAFKYFHYTLNGGREYKKNGGEYVVNPVDLVLSEGNYYLIAFGDKYKNLSNYRVDRMESVRVLEDEISHPDWLKGYDIAKYKSRMFSMFGGEYKQICFQADNETGIIDGVFDKFGNMIKLQPNEDNTFIFRTEVIVSPVFYSWLTNYGGRIRIVSPKSVANDYVEYLKKSLNRYE